MPRFGLEFIFERAGDALGPSDERVRTLPFNSATNIKHSTH